MSKAKPLLIHLKDDITISSDVIYRSKIVKFGNGAMAQAYKKHIGRDCLIIIEEIGQDLIKE